MATTPDRRPEDGPSLEETWRAAAPHVLGALTRRYGDLDHAEDAAQEALLAAATQWPVEGWPDDPKAWLVRVASRRLIDAWRSDSARRRREESEATATADPAPSSLSADEDGRDEDDTLTLLLLCCHPAVSPPSQVALTLRAVGGLTTAQVARAFLVPETTMAQRISRAKKAIRDSGSTFTLPGPDDLPTRLAAVLHVLYLVFTEGHTSTAGPLVHDVELSREAIRLTRLLHAARPEDGEVTGLLALMLLTDARRAARSADGRLVPLTEQDRGRWDAGAIDEGLALVETALTRSTLGPYQLQAAIAAVHAEAPTTAETDWPQVVGLYTLLEHLAPGPSVTLGRAVATGMAQGPRAGLAVVAEVEDRLARHHRLYAVRAHLREQLGERESACADYELAARLTTSLPEQAYLNDRADRLRD